MAEPRIYVANLNVRTSAVPGALGALTDAIIDGRASAFVMDLGNNATDPEVLGHLTRWWKRNEKLLRNRVKAAAFVVPRLWHALLWKLTFVFEPFVVSSRVVPTRERAALQLEKMLTQVTDGADLERGRDRPASRR